ncbi:competence/damage-inducible protein A [Geosporobacter ferrireducens]|uniref:Putative competence-damage inducible protein n=1 Tax=Geosporobacter ferrireducens TaxID=1424294 RepID=A0A1D8GBC4_9FIRM|nr:competence/damage-inducible protein A [Geosporobacter ferrireducens]AOT68219.1 competence/damage-inducible protein A [Geosporobacter ferrireducens]MTI57363.1 competence/damage-inducible protein A [Geosporobacter ferrireducens]
MNCALISIGTELLFGQIINTNTVYLSQQLNTLGINVYYHFTVGDNHQRLKEVLNYALQNADMVITTGGLGPTQDDLTRETIAKAMGKRLVLHAPSMKRLESFFRDLNRPMCENNKKQAYLPEGSIVLQNNNGTAPGFIIDHEGKVIISLPGPPKEMMGMFTEGVMEYLQEKSKATIYSRVLRFFGIGESALETELLDMISNQENPTLAPYAKEGEVSLRITAKAENDVKAMALIKPVIEEIRSRVGEYLYSEQDEELAEVVAKQLMEKQITISLAESCTGGLLAGRLTAVPGISKCFYSGYITYSNEAKAGMLGVKNATLEKYGAVSEETAKEMVMGLRKKQNSDLCVSITGIAGPDGGTDEKPVGLVYIGIMYKEQLTVHRLNTFGDRARIRNYTVLSALNAIRNAIK